jgi:hypothetical protein
MLTDVSEAWYLSAIRREAASSLKRKCWAADEYVDQYVSSSLQTSLDVSVALHISSLERRTMHLLSSEDLTEHKIYAACQH